MHSFVFIILILLLGCKERPNGQQKPEGGTGSASKLSLKDEVARRILVLEAALEKAKAELASLEAARPQDEAAIISKQNAIEAVTQTLAKTRRRFNEMDKRSRQQLN